MDFNEFCRILLEKTDIVTLISRYTSLKRMGGRYIACCPFHIEKTPSFSIDVQKQLYYCFGCHKGGNAITFLRDIENIDSIDAIKMLAEDAKWSYRHLVVNTNPKWIRSIDLGYIH